MFVQSVEVRKPITLGTEFNDDDTEPRILARLSHEGQASNIVIRGTADEMEQLVEALGRAITEARQ